MVDKIKTIFIVLVLPINSVFKHWLQNIILKNVGLTQKVIGQMTVVGYVFWDKRTPEIEIKDLHRE